MSFNNDIIHCQPRTDEYKLLNTLWRSTYSTTYSAVDCTNPNLDRCAVKVQRIPHPGSSRNEHFQKEVRLFQRASGHKSILSFRDSFETGMWSYLVMDICNGKSLYDFIQEGSLAGNDCRVKDIFAQILDGVEHLHSKGVYHRNLNAAKIIIDVDGTAKIVDFGYATDSMITRYEYPGTQPYMAPECVAARLNDFGQYDNATAEVWGLGIVLLLMITGFVLWDLAILDKPPYRYYVTHRALYSEYFHHFAPVSREIAKLLRSILNPSHDLRPTIHEIRDSIDCAQIIFDSSGYKQGCKAPLSIPIKAANKPFVNLPSVQRPDPGRVLNKAKGKKGRRYAPRVKKLLYILFNVKTTTV